MDNFATTQFNHYNNTYHMEPRRSNSFAITRYPLDQNEVHDNLVLII